jgi:cytochrome c biogenesis protein CcmG/thiol:disulfide interchange protein DsbE
MKREQAKPTHEVNNQSVRGKEMENESGQDVVQKEKNIKPFRRGWIIVWLGLLALMLLLALGLVRTQQGSVGVGQKVPDFSLTTFDGQEILLSELEGKVVLVNFWSSWCKPCEQEAADLELAWRYYQPRGNVMFLGVGYVDTEPEAMEYLRKFEISYPNGPDLGTRISQEFRIRGVPETYVIDQEGVLQYVQIGPFLSLSQIRSVIDQMLKP